MMIIPQFPAHRRLNHLRQQWMAFARASWCLILMILTAALLVAINEAGYRQSVRTLARISQAHHERLLLQALLQDILNAETGQRGYLLTGETRYRDPYDMAVPQIDGHFAALRASYAGRPRESESLAMLAKHVQRKLDEIDLSIRMRAESNDDAWQFMLTTDVGLQEMMAIRRQSGELIAMSDQLLRQGQDQIARTLFMARVGISIASLVALVAFYLYLQQTHQLHLADKRQKHTLEHERNALEHEVRERTASLAELATHLQEVRETERGFLARELHDELGSLLTAAKLDVARLRSRMVDAPDANERLQHLIELLNSGIALKRRIIEDLYPSSLATLGLVASLEILGHEFVKHSNIQLRMMLKPVSLDERHQLTIYRMVQEGLANIGKYAQATHASIVLKEDDTHVSIEVKDNGQGFDTVQLRPATYGLAGMRHRIEAAQGQFFVASSLGHGTTLSAWLPTQPAAAGTEPVS